MNRRQDMPEIPWEISVQRMAARAREPGQRRDQRQRQEDAVFYLAEGSAIHKETSARRSSLRSIACAAAITVKVIRNSSNPRAISEEV